MNNDDKLHLHVCEQQLLEGIVHGNDNNGHLSECVLCRREAARLTQSLSHFRDAVDRWSTREFRPSPHPAMARAFHATAHWTRWAVAFAILLVIALLPIYRREQSQKHEAELRANAELLRAVETDLSEDVSPSMEPLLKMTAPDSQPNQASTTPAKQ